MDVGFLFGWAKEQGIKVPQKSDGSANINELFAMYDEWKKRGGNKSAGEEPSKQIDGEKERGYNDTVKKEDGGRDRIVTDADKKKIAELEARLHEKVTKEFNVLRDKNSGKYFYRKGDEQGLTDDITQASVDKKALEIAEKSSKWQKRNDIDFETVRTERQVDKKLPYEQERRIRDEIAALQNGFGSDVSAYKEHQRQSARRKADEFEKELSTSYLSRAKRKDMYLYYRNGDDIEINPTAAIELFTRIAKQYGAEEVHHSATSGSKFSSSVYLDIGGYEVRVSNHELPQTAARDEREMKGGTRWKNEVIFDKRLIREIAKLKTKEDFEKWVLSTFNPED